MRQVIVASAFFAILSLVTTLPIAAHAASEYFQGVTMTFCQIEQRQCATLKTPTAQRSTIAPLIAFPSAELTLFEKKKNGDMRILKTFVADDGTIDPTDGQLVLRGLHNTEYEELVMETQTGKIFYF